MFLAQEVLENHLNNLKGVARERLTVQNTAVSLTASLVTHTTHGKARKVWIAVEDKDVRKTQDGTAPNQLTGANAIGQPLKSGNLFAFTGHTNLSALQFIAKNAGETAYLEVEYYYDDI